MAASKESVDYSKEGGEYIKLLNHWVWSDEQSKVHRDGDNPAIIHCEYGTRIWCRHGKYEKLVTSDGVEYNMEGARWVCGFWEWCDEDGAPHRDGDNPARIYYPLGTFVWYRHGEFEKVVTPDGVEYNLEGSRWNCRNWNWRDEQDKLHRDGDRPARIYLDGKVCWHFHGVRHRLTGPASIVPRTGQTTWFVNGKSFVSQEEFEVARDAYCKEHGIPPPGRLTKRATP